MGMSGIEPARRDAIEIESCFPTVPPAQMREVTGSGRPEINLKPGLLERTSPIVRKLPHGNKTSCKSGEGHMMVGRRSRRNGQGLWRNRPDALLQTNKCLGQTRRQKMQIGSFHEMDEVTRASRSASRASANEAHELLFHNHPHHLPDLAEAARESGIRFGRTCDSLHRPPGNFLPACGKMPARSRPAKKAFSISGSRKACVSTLVFMPAKVCPQPAAVNPPEPVRPCAIIWITRVADGFLARPRRRDGDAPSQSPCHPAFSARARAIQMISQVLKRN